MRKKRDEKCMPEVASCFAEQCAHVAQVGQHAGIAMIGIDKENSLLEGIEGDPNGDRRVEQRKALGGGAEYKRNKPVLDQSNVPKLQA